MTTEYGDRLVATRNEILRTVVGSGLHGIAIEGTDDHDEMGIYIEPKSRVYGTEPAVDHYVWRTQDEGERSGHGDTDLVSYSLRKYLTLAVKGNPTALLPLFAPEDAVLNITRVGEDLRLIRNAFVSKEAVERFLGFMHNQRERMMGGGKRNRVPNRPELVEKYGWDTKYGSHAVRLALQGWEIATTGHLTLPMHEEHRGFVLDVKTGKQSRDEVNARLTAWEHEIREALTTSPLPAGPAWATINDFSVYAHEAHWGKGRRK